MNGLVGFVTFCANFSNCVFKYSGSIDEWLGKTYQLEANLGVDLLIWACKKFFIYLFQLHSLPNFGLTIAQLHTANVNASTLSQLIQSLFIRTIQTNWGSCTTISTIPITIYNDTTHA